jgi:hypothetical protein
MFSPKHRSRFQRCPVCDKDVHRVLLSSHVEVCLEKGSAGGGSGVSLVPGSAGRSDDDKRASDSWGQTKEKESTRAECSGRHFGEDTRERSWETNQNHHPNNKASFSTAGAFAKHLGISPAMNKENDDADGRGVFVKAGARNSKDGTRKSGGPLSGWAVATGGAGVVCPPVHSSLDELIPCSAKRSGSDDLVAPGCKKAAARGDDGMTKARSTDDTDPEKDNEDTEEHAEDVEKDDESEDNKNTDPDVDARREESALAVGDGGLFHFPVRCVFAFPKSARLFACPYKTDTFILQSQGHVRRPPGLRDMLDQVRRHTGRDATRAVAVSARAAVRYLRDTDMASPETKTKVSLVQVENRHPTEAVQAVFVGELLLTVYRVV